MLLDNASSYAPNGSIIRVEGSRAGGDGEHQALIRP
jgi:hypothetical protein